jgi:hypothetical protein
VRREMSVNDDPHAYLNETRVKEREREEVGGRNAADEKGGRRRRRRSVNA